MEIILVIIFIALLVVGLKAIYSQKESAGQQEQQEADPTTSNEGFKKSIARLLSYKESRWLLAACMVIYFASIMLPSKIEIKVVHDLSRLPHLSGDLTINHNHDFGGNLHKLIEH